MILFTLRCANDHEFEGWFRDSDGFDGAACRRRNSLSPLRRQLRSRKG